MRIPYVAITIVTLTLGCAPIQAQDRDIHAEVVEWVFEPCMEVAAAIDIDELDKETIDLGIRREHIAQLMLASRDAAIRELTDKMKANVTWEERRAAYPPLLRFCLGQFTGGD